MACKLSSAWAAGAGLACSMTGAGAACMISKGGVVGTKQRGVMVGSRYRATAMRPLESCVAKCSSEGLR